MMPGTEGLWKAIAGRAGPVAAAVLLLLALLPPATGRAAPLSLARDGGTTAGYAPDDPLLYGPAPSRFGRPRTITVYNDGRLARGWRDASPAPHTLAARPPSQWRGRVLRVSFTPRGGVFLRAARPLDTRGGGYVQLALNGGSSGGQRVGLTLTYDGGHLGTVLPISLVLPGYLPRDRWVTVRVPV